MQISMQIQMKINNSQLEKKQKNTEMPITPYALVG